MRTVKIGVIASDLNYIFQRDVYTGVCEVAERSNFTVLGHSSFHDPRYPNALSINLAELSGLVVIANALPDAMVQSIHSMGKPISLVSHQIGDLPVVMSNNKQGIAELVDFLVNRCNRRKLAFVQGLMDQHDGIERYVAFRRELARHNLEISEQRFLRGEFEPDITDQSIRDLIASGVPFDGIVCCDYMTAIAAMKALRNAGMRVPEDVSVVGFGDGPKAEEAGLTTVAANILEVGHCAALQLISQIKGVEISGTTQLSVRLVERATC